MANRRRSLILAATAVIVLVAAGAILLTRGGSSSPRLSLAGAAAGDEPAPPAPGLSTVSSTATSSSNIGSTPESSVTTTTGPTTSTGPVADPTTTTGSTVPERIVITDADNGKSFVVHQDQQIDIELSARPVYTWSEPESSNELVLHRVSGSGGDAASAVFTAMTVGHSDITARHDPKCYPQCKAPSLLFAVHITVVA